MYFTNPWSLSFTKVFLLSLACSTSITPSLLSSSSTASTALRRRVVLPGPKETPPQQTLCVSMLDPAPALHQCWSQPRHHLGHIQLLSRVSEEDHSAVQLLMDFGVPLLQVPPLQQQAQHLLRISPRSRAVLRDVQLPVPQDFRSRWSPPGP